MTEAEIVERIELLEQQRSQALANVNALNGAIQDCEFWLKRIRSAKNIEAPPATE